MTKSIIYRK